MAWALARYPLQLVPLSLLSAPGLCGYSWQLRGCSRVGGDSSSGNSEDSLSALWAPVGAWSNVPRPTLALTWAQNTPPNFRRPAQRSAPGVKFYPAAVQRLPRD
ncbi:hypothetical protein NDU88_003058 [Pleurodeles waltl]|uniref:Secreted protein n=1 Tax=Pleurodeles waltl TaxID=8319 RepID=A0AAV7UXD4_PLEWA|nr:hypothetical protein NDU88_003058 [Pleurodeles waltl]